MSKPKPKVGMKVRFRKDSKAYCKNIMVRNVQSSVKSFKEQMGGEAPYYVTSIYNGWRDGQPRVGIAKGKNIMHCVNWWWLMPLRD